METFTETKKRALSNTQNRAGVQIFRVGSQLPFGHQRRQRSPIRPNSKNGNGSDPVIAAKNDKKRFRMSLSGIFILFKSLCGSLPPEGV
jgi:hypothetical protein